MAWSTSNRRQELPPDWLAIRRRVFKRDGYRCTAETDYGERCPEKATDCDHIDRGNDHRESNLTSLCSGHHAIKSSSEGGTANANRRRAIAAKYRRSERHPGLR